MADQLAQRSLGVGISRHRAALKSWVVGRIAASPDNSEIELEATSWFHELPLDERSRLVTDLARLNLKSVDLYEIAGGPLGSLFTRFPLLFEGKETVGEWSRDDQESNDNLAVTIDALSELEDEDPAWFSDWKTFELELENDDSVWPTRTVDMHG